MVGSSLATAFLGRTSHLTGKSQLPYHRSRWFKKMGLITPSWQFVSSSYHPIRIDNKRVVFIAWLSRQWPKNLENGYQSLKKTELWLVEAGYIYSLSEDIHSDVRVLSPQNIVWCRNPPKYHEISPWPRFQIIIPSKSLSWSVIFWSTKIAAQASVHPAVFTRHIALLQYIISAFWWYPVLAIEQWLSHSTPWGCVNIMRLSPSALQHTGAM